jgi:hypothetical protein
VSRPTTQAIDTLRRCIGALQACEAQLREDMEDLIATELPPGEKAKPEHLFIGDRMNYHMRSDLADLCALAIEDARKTSQALQADAIAMATLRGEAAQ